MAIPVILSRNGISVYPATIPEAIIDPETGEPFNLGRNMEYTINNQPADSNGNFTIDASDIGAAITGHTHAISDITNLQTALDGKAASGHTHTMVQTISVNGSSVTGDVVLQGSGNIQLVQNGNIITVRLTPHTVDTTRSLTSTDDTQYKVFVGTEEEWAAFSANLTTGEKYLVFIRS